MHAGPQTAISIAVECKLVGCTAGPRYDDRPRVPGAARRISTDRGAAARARSAAIATCSHGLTTRGLRSSGAPDRAFDIPWHEGKRGATRPGEFAPPPLLAQRDRSRLANRGRMASELGRSVRLGRGLRPDSVL